MLQANAKYDQKWYRCLDRIKSQISEYDFDKWIKPIVPLEKEDAQLQLRVPSKQHKDQIESNYMDMLRPIIGEMYGVQTRIFYIIPKQQPAVVANSSTTAMPNQNPNSIYRTQTASQIINPFVRPGIKEKIESNLLPAYTFDSFVEGDCNKMARSFGLAVAAKPGVTTFNPLFIHANSGLGKTHLSQAIGNEILSQHPHLNVLYVSMNKFQSQYQTAVLNGNVTNFIHFYQTIDVLIIDDIQELSGPTKQKTQNTFFNIFNHLHMAGKQIILTSDKPPVDLKDVEERLLTRFKWGFVTKLDIPGYETKCQIIKVKSAAMALLLPEDVIDYLASNIVSNIREIEGAIASLAAHVNMGGRKATVSLAREILKDYVKFNHKEITVDQIVDIVCQHFDVTRESFHSANRLRELVQARQIAMYLAKQHSKVSLSSIGAAIGGRKHSTVLHACRAVTDLMETDKMFKGKVERLTNEIMS